ncbi:hypothetical protein SCAR479_04431 [Seiridium cardinale]|uniref:Stc1 domain-containing protein n=1 Tax=Seiridium cardinale TaxID=138064 RepID=A0ABR2XYC1_9PEZI
MSSMEKNTERGIPLPDKFRCAVGGEWRSNDQFSKNQLAKWYNKKRSRNDGITPANIGITCRIHSGEPATTLKCNGPCGLWKSREHFSTSQRRNNLRWCVLCVQWRAQQDYDSIPVAAPNEANDAIDEREGMATVEECVTFDEEGDGPVLDNDSSPALAMADDDSVTTDEEDEYECDPEPSVAGHSDSHYFDEDSGSDEDAITTANVAPTPNLTKTMNSLTLGTSHSKTLPVNSNSESRSTRVTSHSTQVNSVTHTVSRGFGTALTSVSRSTATHSTQAISRPTSRVPAIGNFDSRTTSSRSNVSGLRDSSDESSTRPSGSFWMPPHLRANENLVTLKDKNLIERHVPGYAPSNTSASTSNVLPHLRTSLSQRTVSSSASAVSHSTMTTNNGAYAPGRSTGSPTTASGLLGPSGSAPSVVSSDSRAGISTILTKSRTNASDVPQTPWPRDFNAYDAHGNVHRRNLDGTSTETSAPGIRSAQSSRNSKKPTTAKGDFARPDQRKVFGTLQKEYSRSGNDHVDAYDSGSADEM